MVSEKDKLHFHPGTPATVIVAFLRRLQAGETADEIRAQERKKDRSPIVLHGYVVGPARDERTLRAVADFDEEVYDDSTK
jgi:hypothetical protein